MRRINMAQRVILVIGLAMALYLFGGWINTRGSATPSGWVGYAPLQTYGPQNIVGGFHPWVRLVIWIALVLVWVIASVLLLRAASRSDRPDQ
jgi:hypothetical protein